MILCIILGVEKMFHKKQKTNMELEIAEQAQIIPQILSKYINSENGEINIDLPDNIEKIVIVASGSSYHCARFAVDLVEKISRIETRAIYSSEFLLKNLMIVKECLNHQRQSKLMILLF